MGVVKNRFVCLVTLFFWASFPAGAALAQASGGASLSQQATMAKVGVVDVQLAILETNQGKAAKAKIEKEVEQQKKNLEDEQNQLKKMSADFDAQQAVLSEADKLARQKQFQEKLQNYQTAQMNFDQSIRQKELAATQQIYQNILTVVQTIATKQGFDTVFDKGAGVLLFAKNAKDITSTVVQEYNRKFQSDVSKGKK